MPDQLPVFPPFILPEDDPAVGGLRRGRRPVIFDIIAPDRTTSLLDAVEPGLRLVLHVNPRSMQLSYGKVTTRIQTRGGWVEFHWGDGPEEITFDAATGGFMRLYTGLSNITGFGAADQGRRETIAYDKYLDLLALFHNNGAIYDLFGNIAVQGFLKISFDGGHHTGWFDGAFNVVEDANTPYMFNVSTRFIIDQEDMRLHSGRLIGAANASGVTSPVATPQFVTDQAALAGGNTAGITAPSTAILDSLLGLENLGEGF